MAIKDPVNIYLKPPHKQVNIAEGDFKKIFNKKDEPFEVEKEDYEKILRSKGLFVTEKQNSDNVILEAMKKAIDAGQVTKAGLPKDSAVDKFAGFEVAAKDRNRLLTSLPEEYQEKMKELKKKKK